MSQKDAGETVVLSGWVQRTRDLGGVVFVWLRDREGLVQLVFDEAECGQDNFKLGGALRGEYVVSVEGVVRMRAPEAVNDKMPNGDVEVVVKGCELVNKSETPPIYIDDNAKENELVRLKYRYLDLRRPSMQAIDPAARKNPVRGPALPGRQWLLRRGDAHSHQVHARGRA